MPQPAATLAVWVTPGASEDRIAGLRDGAVHLRVTAAAREGRANASVEALLARILGVSASQVRIVRGRSSRRKLVAIQGLTKEESWRRLGLDPPDL